MSPPCSEANVIVSVDEAIAQLPSEFNLSQNYPNPFNPETTIAYQLPKSRFVTLKIYNILGQEIKTLINEEKDIGKHTALWDGTNNTGVKVASGIYIYRFKAMEEGGKVEFMKVRKMVFLK
jgi:hypothetical protein